MNQVFKIMKQNRKKAARILVERLKNRMEPPQGPKAPKELEKERLFFWLLRNLELEVDIGYFARPNKVREIKIHGAPNSSFGGSWLYMVNSQYYSKYVEGEVFLKVVDEIVKEFDHLENYRGINYSSEKEIEFVIFVSAKDDWVVTKVW